MKILCTEHERKSLELFASGFLDFDELNSDVKNVIREIIGECLVEEKGAN